MSKAGVTIVDSWRRNAREDIRVTLEFYQDSPVVNVRCWYRAADELMQPGKSGIGLSTKHLERMAAALAKAVADAKALGMPTSSEAAE